jgi:hypothetical protein
VAEINLMVDVLVSCWPDIERIANRIRALTALPPVHSRRLMTPGAGVSNSPGIDSGRADRARLRQR